MKTDVKIKNICPVIGMISSGKSSILNALFNMDYLEARTDTTTKIVTIIRYNPKATKPKLFGLELINDGNDNYTFYKNNEPEAIGKEDIKEKVVKLNKDLQQKDKPEYEKIFHMLEIGEVNFIQKEFLESNDLADVPGVSENIKQADPNNSQNSGAAPKAKSDIEDNSQTVEENITNEKTKKEINYLTQIFRILKNKMNNGIIILAVDKFQQIENYEIIAKLKLVLDKPIENFLLLLNRMDKSENIEEDIRILNEKFVEEFPNGGFNATRNTIVQCSAFQLENELKMEKEFTNLLYYHYINYIMDAKKYNNFMDYLKNFLRNYLKKEVENIEFEEFERNLRSIRDDEDLKKIQYIINRIKEHHTTIKMSLQLDDKDFTEKNMQDCIDNLDDLINDEDGKINLPDQTNNTAIILYYYFLHKNKKIKLFRSHETKTILEYFTMQNMNKKFKYKEMESKLKELDNRDTINKKINNVVSKLNDFFEIYKNGGIYLNQIDGVKNSIKPIINNLKTSKFFYIPLIGVYNSGKSTILNDIIGYKLLPVKTGECTKKGILIAHWDYDIPIIRKAKFICENTGDKNDICYFEFNNDVLAEGNENVRKILNGVNGNFIEKEEDFFYIINVRISFLDIFNDNSIKEKICFVDLPGYGTKNKFETKDIYSKFIKSCKLFIMVARDHFDDKNNVDKINGLLEKTRNYQGITIPSLIKKILFIINHSQEVKDTSEQALQMKKNSLINHIGLKENSCKDINITFFNGLYYQYYLEKKNLFSNVEYVFEYFRKKHLYDYDLFQKGFKMSCERKYESYLHRELKENLKTVYGINIKKLNIDIDKETNDLIDSIIGKKKYSFINKDLIEIKKIIVYIKNNIEQCNYINESNYLNFRFYLYARIMICKYESDKDLRQLIDNNLDNLNKIFYTEENKDCGFVPVYKEITNEPEKKLVNFQNNIDNKIKDLIVDKSNNDVPKILEISIEEVNGILKNLKEKIDEKLKQKKKWKEIQEEFEKVFHSSVENQKTKIIDTLEKCSEQLKIHSQEASKMINDFKINNEDNFKFDELKIYLSNKLGEDNYKVAIDNIVNDIVSNSRTATTWKNRTGFFDFLKTKFSDKAYLDKTIDYIILNAVEKLNNFKKNISHLIDTYLSDIQNKFNIEKINIINILTEKAEQKKLENQKIKEQNDKEKEKYEKLKKETEERNNKWKVICQEYNTNKILINSIFSESEITLQDTVTGEEEDTPTPQ